jgi:hypothetical protein
MRGIMRYVLGPQLVGIAITADVPPPVVVTPPAPVSLIDVEITLGAVDAAAKPETVEVVIPAYDATTHLPPAEVKIFLAPEGSTFPADVDGWLGSHFAVSTHEVTSVPATGETVKLEVPTAPPGAYLLQSVIGYPS